MSERLETLAPGPKGDDRRKNSALFKDPRIDKAISWLLGAAGTVVLATGSYFVRDMASKFDRLGTGQAQISKDVNAFKDELNKQITDLQKDVISLKDDRDSIKRLEKLVERLEERLHSVELRK